MNALRFCLFLLLAAAAEAFCAEPQDPYEARETSEDVLAADRSAPPTFTLGAPFVRSATGWLLPGSDLASLIPEFRLTVDASMPGAGDLASPSAPLGRLERRVKGVEILVPQTQTLWLGWEQPDAEGDSPRATFSIRNRF